MTITSITLDKLKVSPHNVRKTYDKSAMEELKASILAHGLLQNLTVTEGTKGCYLVIAGGRRLTAMSELADEGKLPKGYKASCLVIDEGDSTELSLAENTVRQAMHPADEVEAFAALAQKGTKPAAIAKRFGVKEKHVLQRMKLASLAPEVFDSYRNGKMSLECAQAFTLTDDHELQRKVFQAEGKHFSEYRIRSMITKEKPSTESKLGRFVGVAAYQKLAAARLAAKTWLPKGMAFAGLPQEKRAKSKKNAA